MNKNIGVFLNNTSTENDLLINYNNYIQLKSNFDSIIIIDINNKYSLKLKKKIEKEKIEKEKNTNFIIYESIYILEKIIYLKNNLKNNNSITFIQDKYMYLDKLKTYFNHTLNTEYDLYSFTDSTEEFYHIQLYLFTIKKKIFDNFIDICIKHTEEHKNSYNLNFLQSINKSFENKSVFIKVAYLDTIYNKNILLSDNKFYYNLFENNILPIIDVNLLYKYLKNYDRQKLIFTNIPDDFNIDIYKKYDDLNNLSEEQLKKHFLENGQFECRKYKKYEYILPYILYKKLKNNNLLKYFDFPVDFDMFYYKKLNKDIKKFNKIQLKKHWFEYGINEKRNFKKIIDKEVIIL